MEFSEQYLTYEEYSELGGTLDRNAFNLLEYETRKKLDTKTLRRLTVLEEQPQEVKMCMFNLINKIQTIDENSNKNKNVASESVGSYSVSYVTGNQVQEVIKANERELDDIILNNLFGVVVNGVAVTYLGV